MASDMTLRPPVDVLLTHSYHLYYDRKQAERQQPYPPLGTIYAAALVREAGLLRGDLRHHDRRSRRRLSSVRSSNTSRESSSCAKTASTFCRRCASRACARSVSKCESRPQRAASPFSCTDPTRPIRCETYLNNGFLAVLLGECEQSLVELLHAVLRNGQNANWKIPGLAYLNRVGRKDSLHGSSPALDGSRSVSVSCTRHGGDRSLFRHLAHPSRQIVDESRCQPRLPVPLQLVREADLRQ